MGRAGDRPGREVEEAGLERRELLTALGVAGATPTTRVVPVAELG